eukprot:PhF_6_TR20819/c0_g1_i2/m.29958
MPLDNYNKSYKPPAMATAGPTSARSFIKTEEPLLARFNPSDVDIRAKRLEHVSSALGEALKAHSRSTSEKTGVTAQSSSSVTTSSRKKIEARPIQSSRRPPQRNPSPSSTRPGSRNQSNSPHQSRVMIVPKDFVPRCAPPFCPPPDDQNPRKLLEEKKKQRLRPSSSPPALRHRSPSPLVPSCAVVPTNPFVPSPRDLVEKKKMDQRNKDVNNQRRRSTSIDSWTHSAQRQEVKLPPRVSMTGCTPTTYHNSPHKSESDFGIPKFDLSSDAIVTTPSRPWCEASPSPIRESPLYSSNE